MSRPERPQIVPSPKTGEEQLTFNGHAIGYSLLDFWQWSASDLLSNALRGRFAEFLVGSALGLDVKQLRKEWDAFDLITKDGVKIEVKSAAYIQSWSQLDFSKISFSIRPTRAYEYETSKYSTEVIRQADVYVFCLLNHKDQNTVDPLKAEHWEFYVLPTHVLNAYPRSSSSITLNSLRKLTEALSFDRLQQGVIDAASLSDKG